MIQMGRTSSRISCGWLFLGSSSRGFKVESDSEAPCAEASLFDFLEGGIGRESDRLHKGAPPHRVGSFVGTYYAWGPCS